MAGCLAFEGSALGLMATIVLGAVGRAFAGPVGGLLGSLAGGFVDRALFGGGPARDIGRLDSPQVQSAAYGEAIPLVIGRMRAAGNLIWSSGIAEQVTRSGGGKGGQPSNRYSYSASFAVGLAARRIRKVGRIWADGRLVRDADDVFLLPMTMRVHPGDEDQPVDPLIAAAEGEGQTPAYRGLAYVVFEDLPLADFGNRIPNFTFEIVADEGPVDLGLATRALADAARLSQSGMAVGTAGAFPPVSGYYFGRPGSVAEALAPLVGVADAAVEVGPDGILLVDVSDVQGRQVLQFAQADSQTRNDGLSATRDRHLYAGDGGADVVELGFYDAGRDYQSGLQRVRRGGGRRVRQEVLPAAMLPAQAKGLARTLLVRGLASRQKRTVSLPWRELAVRPGMLVRIGEDGQLWRVREMRFEAFVVTIGIEQLAETMAADNAGDGGRLLSFDDLPAGPTRLHLIELPGLGNGVPTLPLVMVAGAGASAGWRRGSFETSNDLGLSYGASGALDLPSVMGTVALPLPAGPSAVWDLHNSIEVELLGAHMWLEGRMKAAVLQGANLALLGEELVQFADVEAVAPGRFRLRKLLRGRRGTEHAIPSHGAGERFVLLDGAGPVPLPVAAEAVGQTLLVRATSRQDAGAIPEQLVIRGLALRPLSPAHLRLSREGEDVVAHWVRRSRAGFAWLDFVDAPLAEEREAYRVKVFLDGQLVRTEDVSERSFRYAGSDRTADGGGTAIVVEVAQLSQAVGPGDAAQGAILVE